MVKLHPNKESFPDAFGITTEKHKEIWNKMCKIIGRKGSPFESQKELLEFIETLPTDEEKIAGIFNLGTMLGEERGNEETKKHFSTMLVKMALQISRSGSTVAPTEDCEDCEDKKQKLDFDGIYR